MTDEAVLLPGERVNAGQRAADLYRAVWRWHFYAGLLVLPFLVSLSLTGGLYLFKDEIDRAVHSDLFVVEQGAATVAPSQIIDAATALVPGAAVKFTTPPDRTRSAEVTIVDAGGARQAVYVNPYTGKALGTLPDRGTVMWVVRYLHSLKFFGPYARALIEIAAGWSILLVATGLYLWWPRGRNGGVLSVRGKPRQRIFWRDTHAVTGVVVGGVIVFLAITGMPWSNVWGGKINEWANGNNFGYPAGVRVEVPMSDRKLSENGLTAWSMEQAQIPRSAHAGHDGHIAQDPHAGHGGHESTTIVEAAGVDAVGIDRVVEKFETLGLHPGFAIVLPNGPTGVYSGSVYPDDLSQQRVVHLDQYTGEPLLDASYADYGPMGRALEFGINVHLGQEFGLTNQIILAIFCLGIILLSVSAGVMWWKRRPSGRMGVPPMPSDPRILHGVVAILIIGGILFPLVGLSLIIILVIDVMTRRTVLSK
ncbi:PepSY-associated TM helix domain-containing protein [Limoniibacter endophyticus]|uniref:PepSY domain-containing protein n=1 Tax=Limoniibacter endophyticus TaxID=1565040 RepID=A0A8J3DF88_9HYPH|nr:PepSY domain-containing protein [Limoniibacter endophyticus]GHC60304.1 hypothetical protein GCM10010136_00240 [Limoniibacter endophyticus]